MRQNTPSLTTLEVAKKLGYTHDYVSKLCREGYLKATRSGNSWVIDVDEFSRFETAHQERIAERAFFSTRAVAKKLGYTHDYVSKLCREGQIQAVRSGNSWLITASELARFERAQNERISAFKQKTAERGKILRKKSSLYTVRCRPALSGLFVVVFLFGVAIAYGKSDIQSTFLAQRHPSAPIAGSASAFEAGRAGLVLLHEGISAWIDEFGTALAFVFGIPSAHAPVLTITIPSITPQRSGTSTSITNTYVRYVTENPTTYVTIAGNVTQEFVRTSLDSLRDDLNDTIDEGGGGGGGSSGITDITAESLEDLADVSSMTKSFGDFLYWDGSSWANIATSSLDIALSDVVGVLAATKGGTGQATYTIGDLLYADTTSTLARLPAGGSGQVLKISGGIPSWGADATGSGGSGAFATSSDDLSIYPTDTSDVIVFGGSATTTTGNIFEVVGNVLFRNALTNYGLITAPRFTATSSTASVFPYASSTALSTAYASTTALYVGNLTLAGETFTDLTGTGLQNTGGILTLDATGDWTGTFDGQQGTYYLDRTNHTGTQAASTISDFSSAARGLLSSTATGLTYTSGTGVFSLTSAYSIPLAASTTEWNTAYLSRISSATYPLQLTSNVLSLAFGTTTANTWNAQNTFSGIFATNASSTNATTSSLYVTGLSAGGVAVDTTGRIYGAATTTFSAPLVFASGNVTITQSTTGTNGYLSSTDFNTFNNKISSTSLSGSTGIGYVSATGVITNMGVTSLAGTANQITASAATGAVTLSLPNLVTFPNAYTATYGTTTYASSTAISALRAAFGATATTTITSAGFVGVGSTTPNEELSVVGDFRISGLGVAGRGIFADNGGTSGIFSLTRGSAAVGDLSIAAFGGIGLTGGSTAYNNTVATDYQFYLTSAGNVGIGTTTPGGELDVFAAASPEIKTSFNTNTSFARNAFYETTNQIGAIQAIGSAFATIDRQLDMEITSDADISLWPGNAQTVTFKSGGSVGMGTTTPATTLDVYSTSADAINLTRSTTNNIGIGFKQVGSSNDFYVGMNISGNFTLDTDNNLSSGGLFTLTQAGNVGIGSTSPWGQLSVNPNALGGGVPEFVIGSSTATHFVVTGAGNVGVGTTSPFGRLAINAPGTGADVLQTWGYASGGLDAGYNLQLRDSLQSLGVVNWAFDVTNNSTKTTDVLVLHATGNVGVGVAVPDAKLQVLGTTTISSATNRTTVSSDTNFGELRLGANLNGTYGVRIRGVQVAGGFSDSMRMDFTTPTAGGAETHTVRMTIGDTGKVGIGTTTPDSLLRLYSTTADSPWLFSERSGGATGNAGDAVGIKLNANIGGGSGNSTIGAIVGEVTATAKNILGFRVGAWNNTDTPGTDKMIITSDGTVGIGTSTPISTLSVQGSLCVRNTGSCGSTAGTIYATTATITDIDLAENYVTTDVSLAAGEIVAFDPTSPTRIKRASAEDEPAGVISTAPGILLGKELLNSRPLALKGRVPVKVTMEGGVIRAGDRIALSSTPGIGKKATESATTVGIALEDADHDGFVELFVENEYTFLPDERSLLTILASSTAQTTPETEPILNAFFARITGWLGDTTNGIGSVFAGSVRARDTLCVGETCVTEAQLIQLLEQSGQQIVPPPATPPDSESPPDTDGEVPPPPSEEPPSTDTPAEPIIPAPEPVQTPEPQPEPASEPTPESTP